MTPQAFRVFVHERGGRPRLVDNTTTNTIPATWDAGGRTFYFITADLTERTMTFTDVRPTPLPA